MRSAQAQAENAAKTASSTGAQLGSEGQQIQSSLVPGLEREFEHPTGYTPEELNNQLVASEQGAGGANAGIVGQANLQTARTRNTAGYSSALDEAARIKNRQLSQNALGIQNKSAELAQQKQMEAGKQLQGLYGTDVSGSLEAQGLIPRDINAELAASQSGWFQNMTGLLKSLGGGQGIAALMTGGKGGGG